MRLFSCDQAGEIDFDVTHYEQVGNQEKIKMGYVKIRRVNRLRKIYANVATFITLDDTFESDVEVFGKPLFKKSKKNPIHFWTFLSQAGW